MRILDINNDISLNNVAILLSIDEANQLIGYLEDLINEYNPKMVEHFHLNNSDYTKELTFSVYTEQNTGGFSARYRDLIVNDK